MVLYVWDTSNNVVRKASRKELFDAIYVLTMLVPLGKVTSYGDIARVLGINPRIVGLAMKKNKKPIIIPCHRIVGYNGDLKNYSYGGIKVKKKLLRLEGVDIKNKRVPRKYFIELSKLLMDPPI